MDETNATARAKGEASAAAAAAAFVANNSLSRFDSSLSLLTRKFTNLIQVRCNRCLGSLFHLFVLPQL